MSVDEQNAINHLVMLQHDAQSGLGKVRDLRDLTALDVKDIVSNALVSNLNFYVQRVDGLTQVKGTGDYVIKITGIGFGPDSDERTSILKYVTVNGMPVKVTSQANEANRTIITFPNSALTPFFASSTRPSNVRVEIAVEVTAKKILGSTATRHTLPLRMVLYPDYLSRIHVDYIYPIKEWVPMLDGSGHPQAMTKTFMTPNFSNKGHHGVAFSFSCPDDQRFIVHQELIDVQDGMNHGSAIFSNCRKAVPAGVDENGVSYSAKSETGMIRISPDGHTIAINYDQWGLPFQLTFGANLAELRNIDHNGSREFDLQLLESTTIMLPKGVSHYHITGKTGTGRVIDLGPGLTSNYLAIANVGQGGDTFNVTLKATEVDLPAP